ncbi:MULTISPECIES: hypothetical protein [unclassified Bradyrhizobium]|nr:MULTISPECIES: hypothetical protein [unclassified Bradyrhizobium]
MQITNPSASFTRPNNTTAYASGQLVANSTTAGSVVPMSFVLGNQFPMGNFRLTRARLVKSGTTVTNATFRIMLYQAAAPTVTNGDGGAYLSTGAANWLGNIDVTSMLAFSDGAAGTGSFPAGSEAFIRCTTGSTVYALLMAQGAYAPAANEVFTLTIEELDTY